MDLIWTDRAWNEYLTWYSKGESKIVKRINKLIEDIKRHPYTGIGRPEGMQKDSQHRWARRVTHSDRLVYCIEDHRLVIYSCMTHYEGFKNDK
ncbi:Txe/YoeB family addiction module toxin [Lactobacillus delbrueckii]|uniref:Txe/YoeB family addiction module toxin n=1 Tax=Lactobacillus delbrueckii TaxID=1584 RepID=UPI0022E35F83|nr:Txe/YoeB family addiction module toxin [Lactobacillus delbrueckii]